jgi:hypothetical protein
MPNSEDRYELTASLSTSANSPELLDDYVANLKDAIIEVLNGQPLVTAYFASPNYESFEIEVGLRFEGMKASYIKSAADHILDTCIALATSQTASRTSAMREESTLVPA